MNGLGKLCQKLFFMGGTIATLTQNHKVSPSLCVISKKPRECGALCYKKIILILNAREFAGGSILVFVSILSSNSYCSSL